MTDKEQIIVDGIDVSKCDRYVPYDTYMGIEKTRFEAGDCKYVWIGKCEGSNCLFKQLAHKTAECEELKDYAQRQENQREAYYKALLKKTKALEEIEKYCNNVLSFTAVRTTESDILNIINKAKEEH